MKSEVISSVKVPEYPGLYSSKQTRTVGLLVMMSSPEVGIVLAQGKSEYKVGHYSELWDMNTLEQVTASVTIKFN